MTTLQITDLPIDTVRPHPQNVRRELRGIDELADSIKAEGLHQPIIVAPNGDEHVVVMGNSRLAACIKLGWDTIPCIVRDDLDTEEKVLSAMLAENCARNDLTITEEGDAFQRLLDLDLSTATVAKRAGRSRRQVADRVTIASQSERIRRAVDDKQLTLAHAITLAEFTDDHELYARVEGAIGTPRFEYELERANIVRRHTQQRDKLHADARGAGFTEATEKELATVNNPVGGFMLEWLGPTTPEPGDGAIRFTVTSANLEHWAPTIRYYRLVEVKDEPADDDGSTASPAAPATDAAPSASGAEEPEWARVEEEKRAAEQAERQAARDHRRDWLASKWERGLPKHDPLIEHDLLLDLIHHAYDAAAPGDDPFAHLAIFLEGTETAHTDKASWTPLRAAFVAWWIWRGFEAELEVSNYGPEMWDQQAAGYLEILRDVLGYELTDIEDALLDTYYATTDGGDD